MWMFRKNYHQDCAAIVKKRGEWFLLSHVSDCIANLMVIFATHPHTTNKQITTHYNVTSNGCERIFAIEF